MKSIIQNFKHLLRVTLCSVTLFLVFSDNNRAFAQSLTLDNLFLQLQDPENLDWKKTEKEIWREWRKSGSVSMDHLLKRGVIAMQQGRLKVAAGHFSAAIDHAPDYAEAWNKRATAYYLMEEFGLSMSDIRQTLLLNPRHFGAMAGLGSILEQIDRPKDALMFYERALQVHPHQKGVKEAIERLKTEVKGTPL
mgnify:FL=1|jgi:tetratricopeptide (TPR) repeat protein